MKQATATFRERIEQGRVVLAWLKGHAAAAMAVTLLLVAAAWLADHDARVKREAELGLIRREVTSEVSALRQRAEAAIKESRASERAIRDLETRRTVLEREASVLRSRLNSLREEDRLRARPAITPGHNEAAGNATSRPGPARNFEVEDSWLATRDLGLGTRESGFGTRDSGPAAQTPKSQISDLRFQNSDSADGTSKEQDLKSQSPAVSSHGGDFPASSFRCGGPELRIPNPELWIPNPELRIPSPELRTPDARCRTRQLPRGSGSTGPAHFELRGARGAEPRRAGGGQAFGARTG